jgi:hypothetical protein
METSLSDVKLILRKSTLTLLLVVVAVSGNNLPVPMTALPQGEDMRLFIDVANLMAVGTWPWLLSLSLWQVAELLLSKRGTGFALTNPFSFRVLGLMLVFCAIKALQHAEVYQSWRIDEVTIFDLVLPALSLTAFVFTLVFLARMIDVLWHGWGFWILLSAISISSVAFAIREKLAAFEVGAVSSANLRVLGCLTLVGVVASAFAVSFGKRHLSNDSRPFFVFAAALMAFESLSQEALRPMLTGSSDLAIFLDDHRTLLGALVVLFLSIALGLLWVKAWPESGLFAKLVPFIVIVALHSIDAYLLTSPTSPLLAPMDLLLLASVGGGCFEIYQDYQRDKLLKQGISARQR